MVVDKMAEGVLVKGEYVYVFNNEIMKAFKTSC